MGAQRHSVEYPVTPVRPVRNSIGGIEYDDPYQWLEATTPEVLDWQAAQNALTDRLLAGQAAPGTRNHATFTAMCNLLGLGMEASEAERRVLAGAVASGLKESEARHAIRSALRRKGVAR